MAVDKATSKAFTRRPRARPPSVALRLVGVAYGALLLAITVLPIRWDPWLVSYPDDNFRPELVPFRGSGTNVFGAGHPLRMLIEHVGNVLLLVPFGFLLPLLAPRLGRRWQVVAIGAATSFCIELVQITMPGIHRADINDLLLNTAGVAVGWLLLGLVDRRRLAGAPARRPVGRRYSGSGPGQP
jgi:glycopeptide antibiotics resistance protein